MNGLCIQGVDEVVFSITKRCEILVHVLGVGAYIFHHFYFSSWQRTSELASDNVSNNIELFDNGIGYRFIILVWFGTGYNIEEGHIKIKSGPFRSTIKIEEIKKINTKKVPFAFPFEGPALSVNRLEVFHGKYHDVMNISPKNEKDFIKIIVSENPHIQIDKNLS